MGTHPIFESDFDCLTDIVTFNMNGNWGGIASQDFERPNRHIEGLEDPSLDVINTIIASYAASAIDENESRDTQESKENHKMRQNNRDQYYYRDQHHREIHDRDIERDMGMT